MDTKQLIKSLAERLDIDEKKSAKLLGAFSDVVTTSVLDGDAAAIPSFGSFDAVKADEEVVTDYVSGKRMLLPPQISLVFTPAAMLRKKLFSDGSNN